MELSKYIVVRPNYGEVYTICETEQEALDSAAQISEDLEEELLVYKLVAKTSVKTEIVVSTVKI